MSEFPLIEGDGRRMRSSSERMARIADLRNAAVRGAGNLSRIEWNRHQRRAPARSILAGVKAFTAKGMGDERLGLVILSAHAACVQAVADAFGACDEPAVAVKVGSEATAAKASARDGGSDLPRFSARRRMPEQAFALKKYRGGTSPVSRMSDNEHTPSSLRDGPLHSVHSDVLSVKHSVGEPIPEFAQAPEEGSKIPPAVRRQDAGDVLPNQPLGPIAVSNGKIGEREVPAWVSKSLAKSRDGEGLARSSADENIDICIRPFLEFRYVAEVRDIGIVMRQDFARELLDFREEHRRPI